ncbi:UNVERIFIED_CONTAM: hypothetical protein Slati_1423600 [Sesamum latifolium]|uniref:Ty3-gypsy retrotransposon protein n=1 Tax=Sesamum latifolium TaxID=2727402 RepID=A0AAW2X3R6_9LAMI
MVELTNTKQWKDEPVVDYINRWRVLSLNCKDKLSVASAIEMCIQGMRWGLVYILQGIKLRNFEELATGAHNMELSIANHKPKFPVARQNKKSNDEDFSELVAKELMVPIKFSPSEKKSERPQNQHTPHYNSWLSLDEENMANTNVASVIPISDMHVSKNEWKALPSLPEAPPKL